MFILKLFIFSNSICNVFAGLSATGSQYLVATHNPAVFMAVINILMSVSDIVGTWFYGKVKLVKLIKIVNYMMFIQLASIWTIAAHPQWYFLSSITSVCFCPFWGMMRMETQTYMTERNLLVAYQANNTKWSSVGCLIGQGMAALLYCYTKNYMNIYVIVSTIWCIEEIVVNVIAIRYMKRNS